MRRHPYGNLTIKPKLELCIAIPRLLCILNNHAQSKSSSKRSILFRIISLGNLNEMEVLDAEKITEGVKNGNNI